MSQVPVLSGETVNRQSSPKMYHCGTLTYTKAGLLMVGGWLLWGDFCLTLMQQAVVPLIIPLKLNSLGCPNWAIGLIVSSIPSLLGMTMVPYISFKSDRHRGKWGRRIPFIIWTMPFLCVSVALIGFSDDLSLWLRNHYVALAQYAPTTVTIALIGVLMVVFQFFNMFVGSTFWYLFNDVFPAQFLGRLIGALRIVGNGAMALFNLFIFQYAETRMREIFVGAAVLYFVGFGLMCLRVREGEYPPLEGETDTNSKGLEGLKTFFRESFAHPFYWLLFLASAFEGIVGAMAQFQIFFYKHMGLSLGQIGRYTALTGIAAVTAMYFSAIFMDRWHPLRVAAYVSVFAVIGIFMNWVWVFVTLPANLFFWLCMGSGLIATFQTAMAGAAGQPRDMRVFPRSRYGQFSSAQALLRSFCVMIAGVAAGIFIDIVKRFCHDPDHAWRFLFVWQTVFGITVAIAGVMAYLRWYQLGGDAHYHSPAPWAKDKREAMPSVPFVGPQSRWLNVAIQLFDAITSLSVMSIIVLAIWMYFSRITRVLPWFGFVLLPFSLIVWFVWKWVKRGLQQDMERARLHKPLRNGIPHHGVLIMFGIQFLMALGLEIVQVVVSIHVGQEDNAIIFGAANIIANFMLIGGIRLMARVERGHMVDLDTTINAT